MKKPAIKKVVDDLDFDDEMLSDDEGQAVSSAGKQPGPLEAAAEEKSPIDDQVADGKNESWRVAARIVREFHPVPRMVWVIIRNIYGRVGTSTHKIDPMIFSDVEPLIVKAAHDKTLGAQPPAPTPPGAPQKSVIMSRPIIPPKPDPAAAAAAAAAPEIEIRNLEHAVSIIGADVAGSICFIHAICRRVANSVAEKVWRPILDDALLRAHMGFLVGKNSRVFGPGRGMMAGFCGRSGLAILIGSGTMEQAHSALSGLAAGVEIGEICNKVYGCNPLQVAAMAAVSAGFNRDIATGVGSYNADEPSVVSGSDQDRWLAAFSIVENLRMNRRDDIDPNSWLVLAYSESQKADLMKKIQNVQRRGHGWGWLTKPQLTVESEA